MNECGRGTEVNLITDNNSSRECTSPPSNFKNFGDQVTLATSPFPKILRDHVRTDPGNMCVKF